MNRCEVDGSVLVVSPVNGQLFCLECETGVSYEVRS